MNITDTDIIRTLVTLALGGGFWKAGDFVLRLQKARREGGREPITIEQMRMQTANEALAMQAQVNKGLHTEVDVLRQQVNELREQNIKLWEEMGRKDTKLREMEIELYNTRLEVRQLKGETK